MCPNGITETPSCDENRIVFLREQSPQSQKYTLACVGLLAQIAFGTSAHGSFGRLRSNRYRLPPRR
jgi:hypothetical protein